MARYVRGERPQFRLNEMVDMGQVAGPSRRIEAVIMAGFNFTYHRNSDGIWHIVLAGERMGLCGADCHDWTDQRRGNSLPIPQPLHPICRDNFVEDLATPGEARAFRAAEAKQQPARQATSHDALDGDAASAFGEDLQPATVASTSVIPAGGWLAIIAGALIVVGSLLPWFTAHDAFATVNRNAFELGNNYGFSIDGVVCVGLGIVTAVIGVAKLTASAVPRLMQRSPVITGLGAAILVLVRVPSINDLARRVNESGNGLVTASIGYGLWTVAVGSAVAIVAGLALRTSVR